MNSYTPKYFKIEELVDPETFKLKGEKSLALLDSRILYSIDCIRKFLNKSITINNWATGGNRNWSGLRTDKSPDYSKHSQHTYGRAIDFVVRGMSAPEVQKMIIDHQDLFPYVTRMEADRPTWTHIDCANIKYDGIYVFNP